MTSLETPHDPGYPVPGTILTAGFYSSLLTAALTLLTFGIAIFTPPLSGPYCVSSCFQYPYADIASRFPRDYIWMYPAIIASALFIALLASIHESTPRGKKFFSLLGLIFTALGAGTLIIDYFLQVSVIQPSLVNKEFDGISMLSQFNPHGVFIVLEEIGYLAMAVGFALVAPVFAGRGKLERAVRWIFVGGFLLTVIALTGYSLGYGIHREYRFEVAVISIDWLVFIVNGILLSIWFKRKLAAR